MRKDLLESMRRDYGMIFSLFMQATNVKIFNKLCLWIKNWATLNFTISAL